MGPRSFERGELSIEPFLQRVRQSLQWGHVHSNVESPILRRGIAFDLMLQWGHVHSNVERNKSFSAFRFVWVLQWGHVHSNVERVNGRESYDK